MVKIMGITDVVEVKKVKVSVCQVCNGWVRVAALKYFDSNRKAKNEFSREVVKYNLAVREMLLEDWKKSDMQLCKCFED